MIKIIKISIIVLVIIGALIIISRHDIQPKHNIKLKPINYVCTDQQLDLVEKETKICSRTSYFTDYCFAEAKGTICDKISDIKPIKNK